MADFWDTLPANIANNIYPEPNSGCWLSYTTMRQNGYGRFVHKALLYRAHRWMWEFVNGPIPPGDTHCGTMFVLHKCDNPPCCNPDHLYLGTHEDNVNDMVQRGSHRRGKRRPSRKRLTNDQVLRIAELGDSLPATQVAKNARLRSGAGSGARSPSGRCRWSPGVVLLDGAHGLPPGRLP